MYLHSSSLKRSSWVVLSRGVSVPSADPEVELKEGD